MQASHPQPSRLPCKATDLEGSGRARNVALNANSSALSIISTFSSQQTTVATESSTVQYVATLVSDIAIFVLKRDVKLQLTN